jgi:hypothetical protein
LEQALVGTMKKTLKFLILGYLVVFPFGQLSRLPLGKSFGSEVHLYLGDIFLGLAFAFWLGNKLLKGKNSGLIKLPLFNPLACFVFSAVLSLFFNFSRFSAGEILISGLYLVRWLVYAGLFLMVVDLKQTFPEFQKKQLRKLLIVLGVFVAVFSLVQYVIWPDLRALSLVGWDPHYSRAVGTFLDPGFTGLILVLTLVLLVGKESVNKIIVWGLGGMVYLALALTYSRSSYLAFLIGMGVIAKVKKTPRLFIFASLLMLSTFLFLPRPPGGGGKLSRWYSIEARINNWRQAIRIGWDHPVLGVGFNTYRYSQRDYGFLMPKEWQTSHAGAGADSSLLFVFATTGLVGLGSYLWLGGKMLVNINRQNQAISLASVLSVVCHAFFLNSLFYPWVMAWLWLILSTDYK